LCVKSIVLPASILRIVMISVIMATNYNGSRVNKVYYRNQNF